MNLQVQEDKALKLDNDKTSLNSLSKEELIEKVIALQAHNIQLKNIIAKYNELPNKHKKNQKPFNFESCKFRHVLLKFFYLGWNYQGYVCQEDTVNTIEHYLFEALQKTCLIKDRPSSNYHRCGRTDKGVSSFGQVISIDLRSNLTENNIHCTENEINYCKILNKVLPENIRCISWCPVSKEFSARFDCDSRTYKYFFPKGNLDIEKMNSAAQLLIGVHDFRNFCKMDVGNGVTSFERNILNINITPCNFYSRVHEDEFTLYVMTVTGKAFLWHQIRCIMGILFLIGEGKEDQEVVRELLDVEKNPRKPDYSLASEEPLNLFDCKYNESLNWVYDFDVIREISQQLYKMWAMHGIKTVMIQTMLENCLNLLKSETNENITFDIDFLMQGVKCKKYKPLMERPKCESLESRIKHYTKKRKLEIEENI